MNNTITRNLAQEWAALQKEQEGIRIRNAAEILGVSEAELLLTKTEAEVIQLVNQPAEILSHVESLGRVMALSRNNEVVHERKGIYSNPSLDNAHVGLFVNEDIDLRIFFSPWKFAFAVNEPLGSKVRRSLQFFAKDGSAIHKIYLLPESNESAFDKLIKQFKAPIRSTSLLTEPLPSAADELPDNEIDVVGFQDKWIHLQDTHDFFGLLKKYQLSRTQALRLAPQGNYAVPVQNTFLRALLNQVSADRLEIMVFVGNPGIIQIHTGKAMKIVDHANWLNVLDPAFNLHVKENSITHSWVVRKPTVDGTVTSLECFNDKNELILQLFGKRKPGIPELTHWRQIIQELEKQLAL